ncbi:uncharacterized protein LOC110021936 [Phalaenopsis equestris]|uniref:uncharacterized protein LOC110021936 n=1 Tax=Phalaenopsis equestris TaxID=78828 RepID=UPI0009E4D785|nr:uncharacterized protein LOC110021936 [Phalaenopsis equestris]
MEGGCWREDEGLSLRAQVVGGVSGVSTSTTQDEISRHVTTFSAEMETSFSQMRSELDANMEAKLKAKLDSFRQWMREHGKIVAALEEEATEDNEDEVDEIEGND